MREGQLAGELRSEGSTTEDEVLAHAIGVAA